MNVLEARGAAALLKDVRSLLAPQFLGNVPNGHSCSACGASGMGTSQPHVSGCPGVRLLADLDEALLILAAGR